MPRPIVRLKWSYTIAFVLTTVRLAVYAPKFRCTADEYQTVSAGGDRAAKNCPPTPRTAKKEGYACHLRLKHALVSPDLPVEDRSWEARGDDVLHAESVSGRGAPHPTDPVRCGMFEQLGPIFAGSAPIVQRNAQMRTHKVESEGAPEASWRGRAKRGNAEAQTKEVRIDRTQAPHGQHVPVEPSPPKAAALIRRFAEAPLKPRHLRLPTLEEANSRPRNMPSCNRETLVFSMGQTLSPPLSRSRLAWDGLGTGQSENW